MGCVWIMGCTIGVIITGWNAGIIMGMGGTGGAPVVANVNADGGAPVG